jgi:D-3-phosphoglycerate dehydrogenase / 2-oxoglutarate reductase
VKVLVTEGLFGDLDVERSILEPMGVEVVLAAAADEATLVAEARDASALMVVYAKVTAPVVEAAAQAGCRVIARYGIGYDNVDVEAATRHGIQVTYVPDYCLDEVADHTMALLLAFARGVVEAALTVREGTWALPTAAGIHRIAGRRLGLLGVGRIGRRVAERARAFGLRVSAYDPFVREWDYAGVERAASQEEALADADFVSLHAPLTPENRHLVGERTIAMMNRSPLVINTARGGLVDLEAATAELEAGRLGGLALDVTEVEPLPADHPLRRHPRAIITPHMAFYSVEAQLELRRRVADEVARALRGEPPRCPVNNLVEKAR